MTERPATAFRAAQDLSSCPEQLHNMRSNQTAGVPPWESTSQL